MREFVAGRLCLWEILKGSTSGWNQVTQTVIWIPHTHNQRAMTKVIIKDSKCTFFFLKAIV